jgi:hypothetical protein
MFFHRVSDRYPPSGRIRFGLQEDAINRAKD